MNRFIAITGGIGSGKSTVSRCLTTLGYPVYDCDSQAKTLMDSNPETISRIASEVCSEAVTDGKINRTVLASAVFADIKKLHRLNEIVHGSVRADIRRWRESHSQYPVLFLETAILMESNLHLQVDEVWHVDAPESTRLQRACLRDNVPAEAVRARMRRQRIVSQDDLNVPLRIIDNEGSKPLLPQIQQLLSQIPGALPAPGLWTSSEKQP